MAEVRLTEAQDWETRWERVKLPLIARPHDLGNIFRRHLPPEPNLALLEIGCAPGRFLAYFHKEFGYEVHGIEYVESAVEITRRNLEMQGVPAQIEHADFFEYDVSRPRFDIVHSGGFIEHFDDLDDVVARLCALARRTVVTSIPNYLGINGWIMKTLSPKVWAVQRKIDLTTLRRLHEQCGFETRFCDYFGGLQMTELTPRSEISTPRPPIWWVLETPRYAFNKVSGFLSRKTGYFPRTRMLSRGAVYIGIRRA